VDVAVAAAVVDDVSCLCLLASVPASGWLSSFLALRLTVSSSRWFCSW
jgi:hypothetical protein